MTWGGTLLILGSNYCSQSWALNFCWHFHNLSLQLFYIQWCYFTHKFPWPEEKPYWFWGQIIVVKVGLWTSVNISTIYLYNCFTYNDDTSLMLRAWHEDSSLFWDQKAKCQTWVGTFFPVRICSIITTLVSLLLLVDSVFRKTNKSFIFLISNVKQFLFWGESLTTVWSFSFAFILMISLHVYLLS